MENPPYKKPRHSSQDEELAVTRIDDVEQDEDVKDFDTTRAQEAARVFFRHVASRSIDLTNRRIVQLERMVKDLRKRVSFFEAFVPPCSWPQQFPHSFVDQLITHNQEGGEGGHSDLCEECHLPTSCMLAISQMACADEHSTRHRCEECDGNFCEDHIHTCENYSLVLCEDCFREHAPRCDACRSLL